MYHPAFRSLSFLLVVVTLLTGSRFVAKDNAWLPLTDELSAKVDHPFVPLATVSSKIFTGEEVDEQAGQRIPTRVEETVLPRLEQVAGIEVTVVEVADYHNGEFHDRTAEYFAQGADGTVYYVGERDDEYEHGKIVDQDGSWLSGDQGIRPGQFMSADLTVGETFVPENHPNVAIEHSTVIAVDQTITTAAGDFDGCVVTKEVHLPKGTTERKTYCPGVGLVREDFLGGYSELVEFETPA